MTNTVSETVVPRNCDLTVSVRNDAGEWELFIGGGEAYREAPDGTIVLWDLADFEFDPYEAAEWEVASGTELLVQIWDADNNLIGSAVKVLP